MNLQGKLYVRKIREKRIIPVITINLHNLIEIGQNNLDQLKKLHGKQLTINIQEKAKEFNCIICNNKIPIIVPSTSYCSIICYNKDQR